MVIQAATCRGALMWWQVGGVGVQDLKRDFWFGPRGAGIRRLTGRHKFKATDTRRKD